MKERNMMTGFLFIPEHIMERKDVTIQEKMVYGRILGLTKKEGYCYASNEWLGNQLGLSADRISHYINSLVKKGLLVTEIIRKTKKQLLEEANLAGGGVSQKYATTRKIFAYINIDAPRGVGENADKGGVKTPSIVIEKKRTGGEDPTTPPPFSKESSWKSFALENQILLLNSIMTTSGFTPINAASMVQRLEKAKVKNKLETAYRWIYSDVVEGKLSAQYYNFTECGGEIVNNMPKDFQTALKLMDEHLEELEKAKPGFIKSMQIETPKYDF